MTHDGPGDDCWLDKQIREQKRRAEFERSGSRPDPEHSAGNDEEIAFQRWKREHKETD